MLVLSSVSHGLCLDFQPSKKKSISTVKGKKEHAFEPILPRLRIAYKKLHEKRLEIYAPVIGYLGEGSEDEVSPSSYKIFSPLNFSLSK